jgi:hypothetical protein
MTKTALLLCLSFVTGAAWAQAPTSAQPGARTLMDAHNCYPYGEWWIDRIDHALAGGMPLAIEQDLYWDKARSRSVLAHTAPLSGEEPGMETYFFEKIRPLVEAALKNPDHSQWPLITLNLDFKTEELEHLRAVYALLSKYRAWLTTAPRGDDPRRVEPLQIGPVLALTGESDAQQKVFFDALAPADRVLVFGAVHTHTSDRRAAPDVIAPESASNYRRWWNSAWNIVEPAGQQHAGAWTPEAAKRLREIVQRAHANGLWMRFYTLDGASQEERSANGWFRNYSFPTIDAVRERWRAMADAGVDYIASDQYGEVAAMLHARGSAR